MVAIHGARHHLSTGGAWHHLSIYISLRKRDKLYVNRKGVNGMTKKFNKGSGNQNSPSLHGQSPVSGDNSKGNKRNKDKRDKTDGV